MQTVTVSTFVVTLKKKTFSTWHFEGLQIKLPRPSEGKQTTQAAGQCNE